MRCIICELVKEASKEHIIPEALGNKQYITNDVFRESNAKLEMRIAI